MPSDAQGRQCRCRRPVWRSGGSHSSSGSVKACATINTNAARKTINAHIQYGSKSNMMPSRTADFLFYSLRQILRPILGRADGQPDPVVATPVSALVRNAVDALALRHEWLRNAGFHCRNAADTQSRSHDDAALAPYARHDSGGSIRLQIGT